MSSSYFSNNLYPDLDQLVIDMLTTMGLPSENHHDLNAYSTIAIQIHGIPDIMLSQVNHHIWLWSLLPELTGSRLLDYVPSVVAIITMTIEGIEGGQLTLGLGENGYELKGLINMDLLNQEDGLETVFRGFASQLTALCQALQLEE